MAFILGFTLPFLSPLHRHKLHHRPLLGTSKIVIYLKLLPSLSRPSHVLASVILKPHNRITLAKIVIISL